MATGKYGKNRLLTMAPLDVDLYVTREFDVRGDEHGRAHVVVLCQPLYEPRMRVFGWEGEAINLIASHSNGIGASCPLLRGQVEAAERFIRSLSVMDAVRVNGYVWCMQPTDKSRWFYTVRALAGERIAQAWMKRPMNNPHGRMAVSTVG